MLAASSTEKLTFIPVGREDPLVVAWFAHGIREKKRKKIGYTIRGNLRFIPKSISVANVAN
jgi:hypothetical protein